MNANSNQRPSIEELQKILILCNYSINSGIVGYKGKEVKEAFKEADAVIPYISIEKNPNVKYANQEFTFKNLPKPVNSSTIILYLDDATNKGIEY